MQLYIPNYSIEHQDSKMKRLHGHINRYFVTQLEFYLQLITLHVLGIDNGILIIITFYSEHRSSSCQQIDGNCNPFNSIILCVYLGPSRKGGAFLRFVCLVVLSFSLLRFLTIQSASYNHLTTGATTLVLDMGQTSVLCNVQVCCAMSRCVAHLPKMQVQLFPSNLHNYQPMLMWGTFGK